VTRIDLTTSELHKLIAPVLPHASTDKDQPELAVVRFEVVDDTVYGVATDRVTFAATRHRLDDSADPVKIAISRNDAQTLLRTFKYTSKTDPQLRIVIDRTSVSGNQSPTGLGLTVDSEANVPKIVCPDQGVPLSIGWRAVIGRVLHRPRRPAAPAVLLTPAYVARWAKAAAKWERLSVFVGATPGEPVLVLVEDHFVGVWMPVTSTGGDPAQLLDASPWLAELPAGGDTQEWLLRPSSTRPADDQEPADHA
jgi:hypothetical protein